MSLDGKGRLTIPTKYREVLVSTCSGQLVVTTGIDKCLSIYPLPDWEALERDLEQRSRLDAGVRALMHVLVGSAAECEMDAQGRILLSADLRERASLDKRVALVGQLKKLELWDEGEWNQRRADLMASAIEQASGSEALKGLLV